MAMSDWSLKCLLLSKYCRFSLLNAVKVAIATSSVVIMAKAVSAETLVVAVVASAVALVVLAVSAVLAAASKKSDRN